MGMRYGFIRDSYFRQMKMVVFKVCYQSFLCLLHIQRSSQFSCQFGIKFHAKEKEISFTPLPKKDVVQIEYLAIFSLVSVNGAPFRPLRLIYHTSDAYFSVYSLRKGLYLEIEQ